MRALALSALLLGSGCVASLRVPVESPGEPEDAATGTWGPADAATSRVNDIASLKKLVAQYPDSGSVHLRLLSAYVAADQRDKAFGLIERITGRGYRFSTEGEASLRRFFVGHEFSRMPLLSMRPEEVVQASAVAAVVPPAVRLVEAALRDRKSGRIYVTSIVSRGLFRQDGSGGWERVNLGETGSLAGILQAPDGTIWISSGIYGPTPEPSNAFRGLIGFDPANDGVRRIVAPSDANPSDIAIAPDGMLFAADPLTGAIYRAAPDAEALEIVIPTGTFRSAQGMAVSADGRLLYVSDYGYGLALVDLATGAVDRLDAASSPFVDGTDGLWRYGETLVAVQNGTRPMRIVQHVLGSDGRLIVASTVLESGNPAWTEPGSGSISGNELLYVATGQWDRFGAGGAPVEGRPLQPAVLRTVPLAD